MLNNVHAIYLIFVGKKTEIYNIMWFQIVSDTEYLEPIWFDSLHKMTHPEIWGWQLYRDVSSNCLTGIIPKKYRKFSSRYDAHRFLETLGY